MPKVVDPEARRREVAEAVFRVVRRHGLEQASLRNVADEAGLAVGSVRHYFADHDDLLRFALKELTDRLERRITVHVEAVRSAGAREGRRQAVEDLLAELLPLDPDRRDEAEIWLAFATAARTRPTLRREARRMHEGMRMIVGKVLVGDGVPDVEVETERLAALLDGLALDGVLHPDLTTPEVMLAVLRKHLASLTAG
ncbi:TetR/AcrR family transcriptional regulator [Saccharothrix sp. 6-C]|uniref:TetR/AcrR family transcriptional regulator n=1 Tax=Saccharothrix sp. 6-C TaxID=2781735 RepID=UPI001916E4D0|nr:TetR/AcrR family transcriptional regulator [Saccharothrix sp. 6-C]QQQ74851.1 TetR/AcrR family transcriptional regulator [Saccharothrix sp. 6-C]